MLNSPIDTEQLGELKKAYSLVEAPNIDKKLDIKVLQRRFANITDIKKRNALILKSYEQGYSQHMITKVLGLNQATVQRIIRRTKG